MGDVIAQGDDRPRRSKVGLAVGVAAVLALGAMLLPQRGKDEAAPKPTPSSSPPSPSPSPSVPVMGDLVGPRRTAPTGLQVFGRRADQVVRLDVDSGDVAQITGLGDLSTRFAYVMAWGAGAAVVTGQVSAGGDLYEQTIATVYLLRPGAERATRVATAHTVLRGARAGDLVLVTEDLARGGKAVTYDDRGRRRSTRAVPPGVHVVADSPSGLVTTKPGGGDLELTWGKRSGTFPGRYLLAASDRFLLSSDIACVTPVTSCPVSLTDLGTGAQVELDVQAQSMTSDVTVAPGEQQALIRTYILGPDDTRLGENVYSLNIASGHVRPLPGAMAVGPLQRVEWTHDGRGAFLQSDTRWAYWTPRGGLELLQRPADLEVLGVT